MTWKTRTPLDTFGWSQGVHATEVSLNSCTYIMCVLCIYAASSGTDNDSGVNLLESPCIVGVTWTTPTIDVLHQLHRLEPLPLSPDWNR